MKVKLILANLTLTSSVSGFEAFETQFKPEPIDLFKNAPFLKRLFSVCDLPIAGRRNRQVTEHNEHG